MNRKKIAVISKYFYPVSAGIETNTLETYSVMANKLGYDVEVHTSKDSLTEKNIYKQIEIYRGIKVFRYSFNKLSYFPKIDWNNTDFICLHNFNILPHLYIIVMTLFLKIINKKRFSLILTPHGGYNPEWSVFPRLNSTIKQIYHFVFAVPLINISVDAIRAVSEWEKKEMTQKGINEKKITVISNGLEDEAYMNVVKEASQRIKKDVERYGKYLIQVGRVYPIKNYETTIKALPLIPKDIKYVIVGQQDHVMGKSEYKNKLETLAKDLGVSNRVIFHGFERGIDKYYLMKKSIAMVHMAKWESYCNVVHEGLSQGLVCIVADNTALPLLIKNGINGYCVPTYDHQRLAYWINYILDKNNSSTISQMKKNNSLIGRDESWEETARKMSIMYEKSAKTIS